MIGNFDHETRDIWIFLEGEEEFLPKDSKGKILDCSRPDLAPGTVQLECDDDYVNMRPSIGRYDADESLDNFDIVIGDCVLQKLNSGELYHDRIGSYQDLPEASKIWIFPSENRESYQYMINDLEFYRNLSDEQMERYRELS